MLRLALLSMIFVAMSIYDFKVPALDGGTIDLSKYKGKKNNDRKYSIEMW